MMVFSLLVYSFLPILVASFTHPGLLVTNQDVARIQTKLAAQQDPWKSSWKSLTACKYSSPSYTPNAVATIYRGTDGVHDDNSALLWHDAAAAFNLALRWKVTQDDQYAKASLNILNAWGQTFKSFGGCDDKYLSSGLQGYQLANAAELLRGYQGWTATSWQTFHDMMINVVLAQNLLFLNHQASSEHNHEHFFANWELSNMASAMAIGVLTENATTYNFVINYFKNGDGNGAIDKLVNNLVVEPGTGNLLGQGQESGRDQGHSMMDWQLAGVIAQQAWNQGDDLFSYEDNKMLKGVEYFARYNLGYDVPFVKYTNGIVTETEISDTARGSTRPCWELLYNHYVVQKGLDAPWTEAYLNYTLNTFKGYEPGAGSWGEGAGHYDGLGWGSLLYRDASSCS